LPAMLCGTGKIAVRAIGGLRRVIRKGYGSECTHSYELWMQLFHRKPAGATRAPGHIHLF